MGRVPNPTVHIALNQLRDEQFEWLVPGDYTVYLELPEQSEGAGQPYQFTTTDDVTQIDVTVPESGDETVSFNVTCAFPNGGTASFHTLSVVAVRR